MPKLTRRQTDTILAALRLYQDVWLACQGDVPSDILDIAENGRTGDDAKLDLEEINELCDSTLLDSLTED